MNSSGMKSFRVNLVAGAMVFLGSSLSAGLITFVDTVNPANDVLMNGSNTNHAFTHNINDNGFVSTTDVLQSATITINFRDDSTSDGNEEIRFRLDGNGMGTYEVDSSPGVTFVVDVAYLQTDGLLNVQLRRISGDVYFEDSTLTVVADRRVSGGGGSTNVPEPTTLLLLGLGAGAAGLSLRRKSRPAA